MLKKYQDRLEKAKEDLIYAVEEHYEGELEIEDVAKDSYTQMVLKQNRKIYDSSIKLYSNIVSQLIESMEQYSEELENFNARTLFRNREIIDNTIEDLCRTSELLILSIRQLNAEWQVDLDILKDDECEDNKDNNNDKPFNIFDFLNMLGEE